MTNLDDTGGDTPDTFDDRFAAIAHLIDTAADDTDEHRRLLRRVIILRLLTRLGADMMDQVATLLDRLDD